MHSKFAKGKWHHSGTHILILVPERPNFPEEEEKVLKYWQEIDAFQKQLELTKGKPLYTFYDGPPFATGLPHYGHIAAGTIKVSKETMKALPSRLWYYHSKGLFLFCGCKNHYSGIAQEISLRIN